MKKQFYLAALLMIAAGCTKTQIEDIKADGQVAPEFFAEMAEEGSLTKTALTVDEEGVGTVWWTPADEVNIFFGTTGTHYTSKNTENATTVTFSTTDVIGSTESASTNIWGLYPYDEDAVCDGSSVTTTIPSAQQAVPGSFDDDTFTSLAHSEGTALTFYNVLGGIKFSLSRNDIKSITFSGNNDEFLAGTVNIAMDGNGRPSASVVSGEKTITLTPKSGSTFASSTNYYLVMLPTVLSKGFTMTFETATEKGTFKYTEKSVEIKRSVFAKKENIDTYAEFGETPVEFEYVDLGLSVMWASCNLGAATPEEYGDYYAWGATEPWYIGDSSAPSSWKKENGYTWENAPYNGGHSDYSESYWGEHSLEFVDENGVLLSENDAAHVILGEKWRIPTYEEFQELKTNCISEWISQGGVKGRKFTSKKNGNCIFIPAAGSMNGVSLNYLESNGSYWLSSVAFEYDHSYRSAMMLSFFSGQVAATSYSERYVGRSIRPVFVYDEREIPSLLAEDIEINLNSSSKQIEIQTNSDGKVTYSSDTPSVVTVNDKGCLTPVSEGEANITISISGTSVFRPCQTKIKVLVAAFTTMSIDLGLSVKWAACNLGAMTPEEYGDYYAWGATEPWYEGYPESPMFWKKEGGYTWSNAPFNGGKSSFDSSYWLANKSDVVDLNGVLLPQNDAAYVCLGNGWRMPTQDEYHELMNNCDSEWLTYYGVYGRMFTSKINNNKVFFPAAGHLAGTITAFRGSDGEYWTSSYSSNLSYQATQLLINHLRAGLTDYSQYIGCSIRAVKE